jgi:hypothetical protein
VRHQRLGRDPVAKVDTAQSFALLPIPSQHPHLRHRAWWRPRVIVTHGCRDQGLDPLTAVRVDVERYVRWLQDVRRFQPSTVSRRRSIVVGFYRVCVIDGLLPYSPADCVRRPTVPPESPTLGLGHFAVRSAADHRAAVDKPQ